MQVDAEFGQRRSVSGLEDAFLARPAAGERAPRPRNEQTFDSMNERIIAVKRVSRYANEIRIARIPRRSRGERAGTRALRRVSGCRRA
jgi:hypothetical protein